MQAQKPFSWLIFLIGWQSRNSYVDCYCLFVRIWPSLAIEFIRGNLIVSSTSIKIWQLDAETAVFVTASLTKISQHLPSISPKKTSGGVSWRWHGESHWKGKITRPCRPFPSIQGTFSCVSKSVSSGLRPWINQHNVAVSLRPAMAAHKPVEWVQAVITRFDEQVRWATMILWMGVASFDSQGPSMANVQFIVK